MTRRERLLSTLQGLPVDRPAVNFYKISAGVLDPDDPDDFSFYGDPDWRSLIHLAEERSDIIRYGRPIFTQSADNPREKFFSTREYRQSDSRFVETTIRIGGRELKQVQRRDKDFDTKWTTEHFLKDMDDVEAYLELPDEVFSYDVSAANLQAEDMAIGDKGIVMVELHDPLLHAASLFSMSDYLVFAITEPSKFHRLLEKHARPIYGWTEKVAREFPSLWRIGGAEYATEPYLPPRLFEEFEVRYTKPMLDCINRHGGYPRIHCHGRIRSALPLIMKMNPTAIDPVENPNQGDIELANVRRIYGRDLVLFGNIQVRDLVHMEGKEFEKLAVNTLIDGTAGKGRGFVLMPTATPAGRHIGSRTLKNYETLIRAAESFT